MLKEFSRRTSMVVEAHDPEAVLVEIVPKITGEK